MRKSINRKSIGSLLLLILFCLFGSISLQAQDTLTLKQLRERMLGNKKEKVEEVKPASPKPKEGEKPGAEQERVKRKDSSEEPPRIEDTYGPFASFIEEAALSSVYLVDQEYTGEDKDGDKSRVDQGDRQLGVGVLIGDKMLTLAKLATPWDINDDDPYESGSREEFYYRSVAKGSRWRDTRDFVVESDKSENTVFYEKIGLPETKMTLINGKKCAEGILMLVTIPRGEDPWSNDPKSAFYTWEPDWDDGMERVVLPKITDEIIGGVLFDIASEAGTMTFRVAGLLEKDSRGDNVLYAADDFGQEKDEKKSRSKKQSSSKKGKKSKKKKGWSKKGRKR